MKKHHTRQTKLAGTTIVEVAGAVVSLAVLLLCLVPALGSASSGSKDARCLHNLMRIGLANSMYAAADPSDAALPVNERQFQQCPGSDPRLLCNDPIYVGAYEWGGKSGVGTTGVFGMQDAPSGSKYGTLFGFGPATRPLNAVLYPGGFNDAWAGGGFDRVQAELDTQLDLDVYRCPSDTGFTGMHCPPFEESGLSSYDHFGTSYNGNIFMVTQFGGQLAPDFEFGEIGSNSPYLHRFSEIPDPSRTLAYQENNGRVAWNAAPELRACEFIGPGLPGTVHGWHGKDWTFNATFMDGHADSIHMRGYRNECKSGTSADFCQPCIRIRGEGWQVDTSPARYVRTGLGAGGGRPSWEGCLSGG